MLIGFNVRATTEIFKKFTFGKSISIAALISAKIYNLGHL